jgi:hypothetical protein
LQLLQVAHRCVEDLDLVRHVGDLGHVVSPVGGRRAISPTGGELRVCGDGGWGGAPLAVLHRKPSSLPCAARTSSHPAGRRHGITGRHAPRSAATFCHRPSRGRLRWSLLRPLPGLDTRQTAPWDPGGHPRALSSSGWCPPSKEDELLAQEGCSVRGVCHGQLEANLALVG